MSEPENSARVIGPSAGSQFTAGSLWNGTANVCGVLGLIISVAWTFPSEMWKAYFSSQVKMEEDVQIAIGQMAKDFKEYAVAQSANLNDQTRFILNGIATVQLAYQLDKISKYPDSLFNNSSYFQNITLAGLAFQVQRYDDALRFSSAAIVSSGRERLEPVEAYTTQANSILGRDGPIGIDRVRDNYKLALKSAVARQKTGRADYAMTPFAVIIDASIAELKAGSWECGNTMATLVELQLSKPEMSSVPMAQTTLALFKSTRASIAQTGNRPSFVCDYLAALN
jgi:hypothetical protein